MTRLSFVVLGTAQPQGSARAFLPKGSRRPVVTSDNPKVKDWRTQIAWEAAATLKTFKDYPCAPFPGAVRVLAVFRLPRPKALSKTRIVPHTKKPDLDKLTRAVGDALTGILFHDDSQIVQWKVEKCYAGLTEPPHVHIVVEALDSQ